MEGIFEAVGKKRDGFAPEPSDEAVGGAGAASVVVGEAEVGDEAGGEVRGVAPVGARPFDEAGIRGGGGQEEAALSVGKDDCVAAVDDTAEGDEAEVADGDGVRISDEAALLRAVRATRVSVLDVAVDVVVRDSPEGVARGIQNGRQRGGAATSDDSLRAMAAMLASEDWAPAGKAVRDGEWPEVVGWSLARAIELRKGTPTDVEGVMLTCLKSEGRRDRALIPAMYVLGVYGSDEARLFVNRLGDYVHQHKSTLSSLDALEAELVKAARGGNDSLEFWSTCVPQAHR